MKSLFTFVLTTLSLSTALGADSFPTTLDDIRALPQVSMVSLNVNYGPPTADVQPVTVLSFRHSSCAAMPFFADVQESSGVLLVALKLKEGAMDCMGPTTQRDYQLQIGGNLQNRVVVLNPLEVSSLR